MGADAEQERATRNSPRSVRKNYEKAKCGGKWREGNRQV